MISFFAEFSESFILAMYAWPFIAAVLTLPLLIVQYRRYNRIIWQYILTTYLVVLYSLALVSFTLYPLPDNMAEFCTATTLEPRLNPLLVFNDLQQESVKAVLQIAMNAVFFVPLGVFARLVFRWRLRMVFAVGFVTSLAIEIAQLTGIFGLYECSYRLFDVNDLTVNTLGAISGYIVASLIPRRVIENQKEHRVVTQPGLVRIAVATIIDYVVIVTVWFFSVLSIYFFIDKELGEAIVYPSMIVAVALITGFIPYLAKGWSVGGLIVRLNGDDRRRSYIRRTMFYILRVLFYMALFGLFSGWGIILSVLLVILSWRLKKRLPYQVV